MKNDRPEINWKAINRLTWVALIIAFFWWGCSAMTNSNNGNKVDVQPPAPSATPQAKPSPPPGPSQEELNYQMARDKIKITVEPQDVTNQDGLQKAVVHVKNTADKTFSAYLQMIINDTDGVNIGSPAFNINGLKPGEETTGVTWIKPRPIGDHKDMWLNIKWE